MTRLSFDTAAVQALVRHAAESPDWRMGYGNAGRPRPALMLVKDDGIYLMSNGKPGLMSDGSDKCFVAYAKGYDPKSGDVWDRCRAAVGGDDFVEYLDLTPEWIETILSDDFVALKLSITAHGINMTAERSQGEREWTDAELAAHLRKIMRRRLLWITTDGRIMQTKTLRPDEKTAYLAISPDVLTAKLKAATVLNHLPLAQAVAVYRTARAKLAA